MKKFLTLFAMAAVACAALVSCEEEADITGVKLDKVSLNMNVGDEVTLKATVIPAGAIDLSALNWASTDEAVATVSNGVVKAVGVTKDGVGKANISVSYGTFKAVCAVTVKDPGYVAPYAGPVQGTSEWSVIGKLLDTEWNTDFVCAEADGAFVLKDVLLKADDEFKFRKDKDWTVNRGAAALVVGTPVKAEPNGGNLKTGKEGHFDLYYFAEKEAIVVVDKDAALPEIPDFTVEPTDLAIDGYFHEWDAVTAVAGDGALKAMKLLVDDTNVYIYLETDKTKMFSDNLAFAHKVMLCFDNGDWDGAKGGEAWNGAKYDKVIDPWLMQNGEPNMITWGLAGFKHAETVDGDVQKYEFCFEKSVDALFSGEGFLYGAFINNQKCDNSSGSEVWSGEADTRVGSAPAVNQDMAVYGTVAERPEPQVEWDYTPSADYTADSNIWKAVDADRTLAWYYNPNWAGEQPAPEISFKESTYEFLNKATTSGDWQAQLWIVPNTDLVLDAEKKYTFSCKLYATEATPVFFKLYHPGEDGSRSFETSPRISLPKGELYELKVEDFTPIISSQALLIDFGGIPAWTKVFIKDIVLVETGTVTPPQEMTWDYTPSDAFNASTNLWKVADGNEMYYYYHCTGADWNGSDTIAAEVPFMTKTQSTYELTYEDATANPWQNQFFIFPGDGHFVALDAAKTYKISFTMAANCDMYSFVNLKTYDAANAKREGATIHEWGAKNLKATEPVVIEHEFTGVAADNITLIFDFGGNPAGAKVFIKDIVITEVGGEVPPEPQGLITIDGNFDDWAEIAGLGNGTHGMFKLAIDENNLYIYSLRTKEGRYSEIWGSKAGYIYLGLNLDGDDTTGETLWGNGPYEFVGVLYPYGETEGTFVAAPGDACLPEACTLANAKCAGAVTEAGAIVEIAIPLADLPALPETFTAYSWGNKDLSKVILEYPYVPKPATIAEIVKAIPAEATGNSTAVEFEADLKAGAVVSYVNGRNAYIQDATGAILLYLDGHGLVPGDTIKGKIAIKGYWFNGIPETVVAFGDAAEIAHGDAPAPKEMTIAQLLADYDANLLRYIVIKDVKVTDGIADGDRNGAIAQADGSTIAVYAQINNGGLVLEEGAEGDFVTIPAYYKANKQVYLWENAWFTKAPQGSTGEDLGGSDDVDPWN